jgi:hypothetical protein
MFGVIAMLEIFFGRNFSVLSETEHYKYPDQAGHKLGVRNYEHYKISDFLYSHPSKRQAWYQGGSCFLLNVGSGFHCLYSFLFGAEPPEA